MVSGFGESTSRNGNGDVAGNFECNICLDLAQDPIVTLCGHLFCWSCLYKWLHLHSQSQECPVCKALVQVDKLVPLYGRGQSSTDPRSKSIHGDGIPDRPSGQRPETAPSPPPPQNNHFHHQGFGVMGGWGGFTPVATARFGNFPLSAAVGGLIPSFLNFQMRGFANAPMYGAGAGYNQPYGYGYANPYHGVHPHVHHRYPGQGQQDNYLKMLLLVIAVLLLLTLVTA